MIWRLLQGDDIKPAFLVNACPKHGLHLAAMLVQGFVPPQPDSIYNSGHWLGTFRYNSFIPAWQDMERWFFMAKRMQQGAYSQGHVGWRPDIAEWLRQSRIAHVFMYRDLRDVAVSMAHHLAGSGPEDNKHPAGGMYRALLEQGGFDAVLSAVIAGMGPIPGVVDMWALYANWLEEDGVHCLRYEDAVADREGAARGILEYGINLVTRGIWEDRFVVDKMLFDKAVHEMAQLAARTDLSPTFRRGQPGEWREVFTAEHRELFRETGGDEWTVRLGYEV